MWRECGGGETLEVRGESELLIASAYTYTYT